MPLHSTIDPTSSEFARNADVMRGLVAELREKLKVVSGGGGEASRKRHTSRGKMPVSYTHLTLPTIYSV